MNFTIRRVQISDAAAITEVMGDPEVFANLMQLPYPSEEVWRQRLAAQLAPGSGDFMLVAEVNGKVVASASLHPAGQSLRRRHAMLLGISVAGACQRQGIGSALMRALLDYADNWANVLRVELGVYADNDAAIALYKRFGFEVAGVQRAHALRNGRFADTVMMARLHPTPPRWD